MKEVKIDIGEKIDNKISRGDILLFNPTEVAGAIKTDKGNYNPDYKDIWVECIVQDTFDNGSRLSVHIPLNISLSMLKDTLRDFGNLVEGDMVHWGRGAGWSLGCFRKIQIDGDKDEEL